MKKRASLSLSVNAIVVLILAIVMLGLGLGFIRGMFGKVSADIEEQIGTEPEPPIPSHTNPITLSREAIITHSGSKEVLKVSTFNPTNEDWSTHPSITCTGMEVESPTANTKDVAQGKFVTFNLIFGIPSSVEDTYLCVVTMEGYKKDLSIKVMQ
jgi:hypothetical protein